MISVSRLETERRSLLTNISRNHDGVYKVQKAHGDYRNLRGARQTAPPALWETPASQPRAHLNPCQQSLGTGQTIWKLPPTKESAPNSWSLGALKSTRRLPEAVDISRRKQRRGSFEFKPQRSRTKADDSRSRPRSAPPLRPPTTETVAPPAPRSSKAASEGGASEGAAKVDGAEKGRVSSSSKWKGKAMRTLLLATKLQNQPSVAERSTKTVRPPPKPPPVVGTTGGVPPPTWWKASANASATEGDPNKGDPDVAAQVELLKVVLAKWSQVFQAAGPGAADTQSEEPKEPGWGIAATETARGDRSIGSETTASSVYMKEFDYMRFAPSFPPFREWAPEFSVEVPFKDKVARAARMAKSAADGGAGLGRPVLDELEAKLRQLHRSAEAHHARDPWGSPQVQDAKAYLAALACFEWLQSGGLLENLSAFDQRFLLSGKSFVSAWSHKVLNLPVPQIVGAYVVQREAHRRPARALYRLEAFRSLAVPCTAVVAPLPYLRGGPFLSPVAEDAEVLKVTVAADDCADGLRALEATKAMDLQLGLVLPAALARLASWHASDLESRANTTAALGAKLKEAAKSHARELRKQKEEEVSMAKAEAEMEQVQEVWRQEARKKEEEHLARLDAQKRTRDEAAAAAYAALVKRRGKVARQLWSSLWRADLALIVEALDLVESELELPRNAPLFHVETLKPRRGEWRGLCFSCARLEPAGRVGGGATEWVATHSDIGGDVEHARLDSVAGPLEAYLCLRAMDGANKLGMATPPGSDEVLEYLLQLASKATAGLGAGERGDKEEAAEDASNEGSEAPHPEEPILHPWQMNPLEFLWHPVVELTRVIDGDTGKDPFGFLGAVAKRKAAASESLWTRMKAQMKRASAKQDTGAETRMALAVQNVAHKYKPAPTKLLSGLQKAALREGARLPIAVATHAGAGHRALGGVD
eukprot:CAMPEP_0172634392 /NCGR_PEP_ID=MMETSP1068-20121228/194361_1 /TAXON_ID=35684 /ORGANISM="Pseudopedinella elastica, Strain CCMP716" /LENGTH=933 /DNA_ID=CAMNT_0013446345 /DNA_START=233 /DNA_END=3034 /DNA_ORIENTATION=+